MRYPTPVERYRYDGGISLDDLDVLVPSYVRQELEERCPGVTELFVEVEWDTDDTDRSLPMRGAVGVIRKVEPWRREVFVDFGFRQQYWMTEDELKFVQIHYAPPSAYAEVTL